MLDSGLDFADSADAGEDSAFSEPGMVGTLMLVVINVLLS